MLNEVNTILALFSVQYCLHSFFFFFFFFVDFSDGSHSFKGPAGIACHAFEHLIEVAFY